MAMIDLGKLGFDLVLNKKGWNEDFTQADEDIEKHESKWNGFAGNISGKVKTACVGGIVGITAAVGAMAVAGVKSAMELDDQMQKFQATTGKSDEEVSKVKDTVMDLYKVNEDSYEDIAKTTEAMSTALQMNADSIKEYAQNYMDYAKVTGQNNDEAVKSVAEIRNAWGLADDELPAIMDKLKYSQENYGLSVADSQKALKDLAPSMKGLGMNANEGIGYLNMFKQAGVKSTSATTAFSYALKKVNSPDELKSMIKDIQNTEDATERSKKAVELFGAKAGIEMANALKPGTQSLDEIMTAMEGADGAVGKASANYDKSLKVQWALMKKQLSGLFTELGEKLSPLVRQFVEWLSANMPKIVAVLNTVFDAIGFAIDITIGNIIRIANKFKEWFTGTSEGATEFKGFINTTFETLKEIFASLQVYIDTTLDFIQQLWNKYGNDIKNIADTVWNSIKIIIETVLNVIKGIIDVATKAMKGDWKGVWEAVGKIFKDVWEGMKKLLPNLLKGLKDILLLEVTVFKNIGKNLFNAIWEGMKSIWTSISNWVSEKVSWLADKLSFWKKGNKEMEGSNGGSFNGSHFNGLSYVPFDGYVARLHEGERVLTKEENKSLGTGSGITQNVTINSPVALNASEIKRTNRRVLQELALQF